MDDLITRARQHLTEEQETAAHPQKSYALDDFLNGEAFFELMQAYRHCPFHAQKDVVVAFEAVKKAIRQVVKD